MIENVNASKNPSTLDFVEFKRYIGVASVNVVAVNPNNDKLRKYGWNIPDNADEPDYVVTKEKDGKIIKYSKVRFLVQIQDLEDKPIVALDFFCRPDFLVSNKDGIHKWKIIDSYGRTAWATKEEIENKRIPQAKNGEANISVPYSFCHPGQEELVKFLFKYLNVTPLAIFNKAKNEWVSTKNPGRLTIDHWDNLCSGNVTEIVDYLSLQPENRVKVVLGIYTTDTNKSYQTFITEGYISNGASVDINTGEYTSARKFIDKYGRPSSVYSATPVKEWKETPTEVTDNSGSAFEESFNESDDLPFFGE